MFTAGTGVAGVGSTVTVTRPILMGFGEQLKYEWLQIDPHQKV